MGSDREETDDGADDELRALRRHVADLEGALSESQRAQDALRLGEERFRMLATHLPVGVYQTDANGDCVYANERWLEFAGLTLEQALGPGWSEALHPEDRNRVHREWYEAAIAGREFQTECRFMTPQGKVTWLSSRAVALRDEAGAVTGHFGTVTDMTERRRAEEAYREGLVQQETIRAQEAALAELSTPLVPINDRVVAMPLIGAIDARRAARVLEALLVGVAARGAQVTILDITGVPTVDAQVADALVRAARAVRLLGAQMVLSGIRPDVAQTLVELGVDLGGIVTVGSLQAAIAHAMRVAR